MRQASTLPTRCSEIPKSPREPALPLLCRPRVPPARDFTCNYPLSPSSPFILLLSPRSFFPSLHLPNMSHKVHIQMQRSQPQGHLSPQPEAALSLETSLSCSLTSSKKAQIMIIPSTFLQTRLFGFLSLDQLSS